MGRIRTIYDNLMQGATLGFADEITSGLASLPVALMTGQSISDVYRQGQELDKKRLSRQREMYPYTSIASEIAGGIMSPVSMKAAQYVGKGKGALGRAMAVGAGEGGLYGFGTGEGLKDRVINTALGAALGGVSAGTAQSVIDDLARGSSSRIRKFITDESGTVGIKQRKGGTIRLYRGLTQEYDDKYPLHMYDAPTGYSSWTDNPDLAKAYAGDNGYVYYTDLPISKMGDELIDIDGERALFANIEKPAGLHGISGDEYLVYLDHDDFPNYKVKKLDKKHSRGKEAKKI